MKIECIGVETGRYLPVPFDGKEDKQSEVLKTSEQDVDGTPVVPETENGDVPENSVPETENGNVPEEQDEISETTGESVTNATVSRPSVIDRHFAVNGFIVAESSVPQTIAGLKDLTYCTSQHNGAVTGFEKSKRYTVSDKTTEEHIAVKPSLVITFRDKSSLFYEVVRKSLFWQTELENKLSRYRILRDNWDLPDEMPPLVICCEDEQHAKEVKEIVRKSGLEVFYTHDLLLFGESFNHHLFTIGDNDEILCFKISFDEEEQEKTV